MVRGRLLLLQTNSKYDRYKRSHDSSVSITARWDQQFRCRQFVGLQFSTENTLLYHLWTRLGPLCDVGSTFAESFLWSSWEPPIGDCLA